MFLPPLPFRLRPAIDRLGQQLKRGTWSPASASAWLRLQPGTAECILARSWTGKSFVLDSKRACARSIAHQRFLMRRRVADDFHPRQNLSEVCSVFQVEELALPRACAEVTGSDRDIQFGLRLLPPTRLSALDAGEQHGPMGRARGPAPKQGGA